MKSANEELQSNNEELQSTNEELDTSREELQSLNEELNTVNSELQDKNELLSRSNDDLNNFVNRTDIAIILLDEELKIRSYTPVTSDIFNIRNIDIGRPLDEITSRLAYDKMVDDAREVPRTLQPKEVEVQRKDGHWYNMRITSYRTAQNVVSGLVMSFLDINEQKKAADSLRETSDYLNSLFDYANAPIMVWNAELKITRFNHAFERLTGRNAAEVLGKRVDILIPQDKRQAALQEINRATLKGERWETVEIPVQHVDGSVRIILWNSATIFDVNGKTPKATIAQGQDITERKRVEQVKDEFIGLVSHEIRTPLTILLGALITAMTKGISGEDKKTLLDDALHGAESLNNIVDNMIELSRYQSARLSLQVTSIDIEAVVRNLAEKEKLYAGRHRFIIDIPKGLPPVSADKIRIDRMHCSYVDAFDSSYCCSRLQPRHRTAN